MQEQLGILSPIIVCLSGKNLTSTGDDKYVSSSLPREPWRSDYVGLGELEPLVIFFDMGLNQCLDIELPENSTSLFYGQNSKIIDCIGPLVPVFSVCDSERIYEAINLMMQALRRIDECLDDDDYQPLMLVDNKQQWLEAVQDVSDDVLSKVVIVDRSNFLSAIDAVSRDLMSIRKIIFA